MDEYLKEFKKLLEAVISWEDDEGIEEFKNKVIEMLNETD